MMIIANAIIAIVTLILQSPSRLVHVLLALRQLPFQCWVRIYESPFTNSVYSELSPVVSSVCVSVMTHVECEYFFPVLRRQAQAKTAADT